MYVNRQKTNNQFYRDLVNSSIHKNGDYVDDNDNDHKKNCIDNIFITCIAFK